MPPPGLGNLPDDVLRLVHARLGPRDHSRFAATARGPRRAGAERAREVARAAELVRGAMATAAKAVERLLYKAVWYMDGPDGDGEYFDETALGKGARAHVAWSATGGRPRWFQVGLSNAWQPLRVVFARDGTITLALQGGVQTEPGAPQSSKAYLKALARQAVTAYNARPYRRSSSMGV